MNDSVLFLWIVLYNDSRMCSLIFQFFKWTSNKDQKKWKSKNWKTKKSKLSRNSNLFVAFISFLKCYYLPLPLFFLHGDSPFLSLLRGKVRVAWSARRQLKYHEIFSYLPSWMTQLKNMKIKISLYFDCFYVNCFWELSLLWCENILEGRKSGWRKIERSIKKLIKIWNVCVKQVHFDQNTKNT